MMLRLALVSRFVALSVLFRPSVTAHGEKPHVYYADLIPFGNTSTTTGMVGVFVMDEVNGTVGYTGVLQQVEPLLNDAACSAPNGCGVHIHEGTSCESVESQMGHYFQNPPIAADPWEFERYYSDAAGNANFGNVIQMGTSDVEGRAFIVHDSSGARVACGLLKEYSGPVYTASTDELAVSGVTGYVASFIPMDSTFVFLAGSATGLEPDLRGPPNGTDCLDPNGCGVHIHSGTSCFNTTTQGGHLYNNMTLAADPWALVYYNMTSSDGQASFAKTVNQSVSEIEGRAFVIHGNNGTRVSCGLLQAEEPPTSSALGTTIGLISTASIAFLSSFAIII